MWRRRRCRQPLLIRRQRRRWTTTTTTTMSIVSCYMIRNSAYFRLLFGWIFFFLFISCVVFSFLFLLGTHERHLNYLVRAQPPTHAEKVTFWLAFSTVYRSHRFTHLDSKGQSIYSREEEDEEEAAQEKKYIRQHIWMVWIYIESWKIDWIDRCVIDFQIGISVTLAVCCCNSYTCTLHTHK